MIYSLRYATHIAALMKVLSKTDGDVLEMGMGVFSTPLLHHICTLSKRNLVSYDGDKSWVDWAKKYNYENDYHKIYYVEYWSESDIEKPWDVALIDHSPDYRRKIDIKRLANHAKYVVVHDANGRYDKIYHYYEVFPLFKYKKDWTKDSPHTSVLSNFVDLKNLW